MRKLLKIAFLWAAVLSLQVGILPGMSTPLQAQTMTTIVANGTETNNYVPVYGFYADAYVRSQSIYPVSMLDEVNSGDTIHGLTFFASTMNVDWGSASFSVKLGEVTTTSLSSFLTEELTTVYSGALSIVNGQMAVTFTTPYIYEGGNLLLEVVSTATGSYTTSTYYGVSSTGSSVQGYSYSGLSDISASQRNFLAKMQITYSPGVPPTCFKVKNLTASMIDSNEITLNWVDTLNSGATYTIAYWTDGGDTNYDYSADTFATVTGLSATTVYYFAVTPDCGDGSVVNPVLGSWRTACGTTAIPYTEGFEGMDTYAEPNCWTVVSGNPYVRTSYPHTGSQHLHFSGAEINAIALPPFDQPVNELQLRFWVRPESYTNANCGKFSVGYMTDLSDNSTFVTIVCWRYNEWTSGTYVEKEVPLMAVPDGAYVVLRQDSCTTNWYWFVDDFVVEPIPACARPVSVTVNNITETDADVTVNGVDGSAYRIYWTDGTTTDSTDIAGNTYTLTGLNPNTLYTLSALTVCDDGTVTTTVSTTFRTACGIMQAPYATGFEGLASGDVPECWQQVQTGYSSSVSLSFPAAYNYASNARTGSVYFEFEGSNGQTEVVALPQMENISQLALTFYASLMNHNFVLEAGVMEDTAFVVVDTVDLVAGSGGNWHGSYYPYTVYFANYTGSGNRMALRVTANGSYTLMMDDFSVEEFSGCYPVSNLTATDVDSSSITLSWEDNLNGGASYIVYYWTDGGDTTIDYANDTTVTITGLGGNTMYYFDVTADCGSGESPAASGNWRTECGTTAIPFTEGFEGLTTGVPPTCWSVLNGNPRVMSSYPRTGTRHLYFSGATPNTIALPPMGMPTSQLQIRFWTRPESYSYSSCGSFAVGYMTDLNVDSTYVQLASWSYNEWTSDQYVEKEVPMIGAPDTAFIVLRHNSGSSNYYWYVDDIVVEPVPSCNHPISVSVDSVSATDAQISILGAENSTYRLYYSDGSTTDSVDITTDTYTLTGLTGSTNYIVTVATVCEDGSLTSTVSATFRTECTAGNCDLVIDMEDGYGDGWNGCAVYGFLDGEQMFSATISDGSTGSFTYSLCATDTLVLKWHNGNYPDETSFTVTSGGEEVVTGSGDDYSDNEVIGTVNGCPSCVAPTSLVATAVTENTIDVSFGGGEGSDYILVITDGQAYADTVTVNGLTTYTFTNLNSTTTYQISVFSDCGNGEMSNPRVITVSTTAVATPLPYSTGFEPGDDLGWILVNGNETNKWYIDSAASNGGSNSLYISNNNGASNQYSNTSESHVFATKLLSFDSIGDYAISYDWRSRGENNWDFLRVFLAPASAQIAAGDDDIDYGDTPAGWIALDGGDQLGQSSTWQNYSEIFSINTPDNYLLVFYWENDGSAGTNPPAAVDNVQVSRLSCPAPQSIEFDNIGASSVSFHWTPAGSESEWTVTVNGVTTLVNNPSATVNGLDAMSNYIISVRAVCGQGDTSFASTVAFSTGMCDGGSEVSNFDANASSTTSYYGPIGYSLYNYSYVQTIIDSADMAGMSGDVTAFAFQVGSFVSNASTQFDDMSVFMANVSESDLSSGFIHPDASHTFVNVIVNASFNYTESGWQIHIFDSAFTWDGHSNVLLAVKRDNGSYSGSQTFVAHTATASKMRYVYRDASAYGIDDVTGGTATSTVGNVRLISCGAGCAMPNAGVSNVDAQNATVTANGSGILFELRYGTDDVNYGITLTSTTGVFQLTGLQPETQYFYAVRQQCDSAMFSNWNEGNFTTLDLGCLPPTGLTVTGTGYTDVTLAWTPGNDETAWEVHIFNNTTDRYETVTTTTPTITGLDADMPYSAAVRSLCGTAANIPGIWGDTVQFTTDACQAVGGVTVSAGSTTASVNWTATGAASYRVVWGLLPFNPQDLDGDQTVTTNSIVITGLDPEESYAVVVYNNCAEGVTVPSTPVEFTTLQGGVDPTYYTVTVSSNNPDWGTVTGGGQYAEGSNATITATPANGYRFVEWNDHNTDNPRTFVVTGDMSFTAIFEAGEAGIGDVVAGSMSLYPNPASTSVTLGLEGFEGEVKVDVVDMNGRVVYTANTTSNTVSIDVSDMPQGAYFVRVVSGTRTAVSKLIVK